MYLTPDLASDPAASAFEGEHIFFETLKEVRVFGVDSGPVSINILII